MLLPCKMRPGTKPEMQCTIHCYAHCPAEACCCHAEPCCRPAEVCHAVAFLSSGHSLQHLRAQRHRLGMVAHVCNLS